MTQNLYDDVEHNDDDDVEDEDDQYISSHANVYEEIPLNRNHRNSDTDVV